MNKGILILVQIALLAGAYAAERIPLDGEWRFALDRADTGMAEKWFERELEDRIHLPGALQNQNFGDNITTNTRWTGGSGVSQWFKSKYDKYRQPGNIKIPFFLQPDKHYVGTAWYQRDIEIPNAWQGRRVVLTLERAHWKTQVWLDDKPLGSCDSLAVPHVYDLGTAFAPGRYRLSIRVDNRLIVDIGSRSHSVSDETQGNWNGLIGRLSLSSTTPVWIEDAQVYPDLERKTARAHIRIGNATGREGRGVLKIGDIRQPVSWSEKGGETEVELVIDDTKLWDEFNPILQRLDIGLSGDQADDRREVVFGIREIGTRERELILNGRPLFLRGTLECCIFPLTGYPPTDLESWRRIIRICKEHGLNHIRFHSWCPPEAAFVAADEAGFYYQVEVGAWTKVGEGQAVDQWLHDEAARIIKAYGNHPSFLLMAHGNEPHKCRDRDQWLGEWVKHWKQADPRRLHTSGSGWPVIKENQFHVSPAARGPKGWQGQDYSKDTARMSAPVIVHEMGQWCVYPDFDQISKFNGSLTANNLEIARDFLRESGMLHQARDFMLASGKLQVLCYKEEVEAALRMPGIAGVQLLDLHDFPGQGTALVGVLDAFWDSKPYCTFGEYRRFYNTTVPLVRLSRRTWANDETLEAEVEIAHFGAAPLNTVRPYWKVVDSAGRIVAGDDLPAASIPLGQGTKLGQIHLPLKELEAPRAYRLMVGLQGTPFENDWDFWVYPSETSKVPAGVLVSTSLDESTRRCLDAEGRVVIFLQKTGTDNQKLTFEPVFWNRFMWQRRPEQTLGMLIDSSHPALADFPTEYFQDWQWHEIVTRGYGIVLDDLPRALQPIVQPIDDWNSNRKLGLIFEVRVGRGKLLVCAADLSNNLQTRAAARQLRSSLLAYAASEAFSPKIEVDKEKLTELLRGGLLWDELKLSTLVKLGARVIGCSSENPQFPASSVIDENQNSFWHTDWHPQPVPPPHHLIIDLGRIIELQGIKYLPRQDMDNGRWADCEVFAGNNKDEMGAPIASAHLENKSQWQSIPFKSVVKARYLKVLIKSEVRNRAFASAAELDVILREQ
jgi:beta-galactosidase